MSHEIDRRSLLRLGAASLAVPCWPLAPPRRCWPGGRPRGTPRARAGYPPPRTALTWPPTGSSPRCGGPCFPPRNFPVTRFGAVGDGTTKNTAAFAAAIAACHRAGGGHVLVPAGTFLTGAIHLLSHVDLHVESGATILFSQDPNDFLPVVFTRWQGIELMNYSPFIYSYGQRNIAVTGQGTLNGQADANHWWNWKNLETPDFNALEAMADDGTPVSQRVFGSGHFLPPQMIQPFAERHRAARGRHRHQQPVLAPQPQPVPQRDGRRADDQLVRPEHRRLRPRVLRRRGGAERHLRHRRRLHGDQVRRDSDGRRVNVPCQNVVMQNCNFATATAASPSAAR